MSQVIMAGNGGFMVAWVNHMVERNSTNTCICSFSWLVAESPWTSINQNQAPTTHNVNQYCQVHFYTSVGQPLSKQLYTSFSKVHP